MSILNYSQPNFYKFNSDSIELVNYALTLFKENRKLQVLDLCAGCGIVGIDFYTKYLSISKISFIEVQKEFEQSIICNTNHLNCSIDINIVDFKNYSKSTKFDLILCNPPYFIEGTGRVSSSEQRQICRTTSLENIKRLLSFSTEHLSDNGEIVIVHRENLTQIDNRFIKVKELNGANLFRFILNVN